MTEWGCMQALIDFEGWRKWRGFLDSPQSSSPNPDSAASPMQDGSRHESLSQAELGSPLITRHASKAKPARHKLQRPNLPGAAEILRENSWASGSPDDGVESPMSLPATPAQPESKPPTDATPAPAE